MGQAGKYLRRIAIGADYAPGGWAHWCPGCSSMHAFAVDQPFPNGAQWKFDGNLEAPTFTPSMNIRTGKYADPQFVDEDGLSSICHYFLTAGNLIFTADSTHALAGKTVPLPELPAGHRDI
jgi:hypothetical protein